MTVDAWSLFSDVADVADAERDQSHAHSAAVQTAAAEFHVSVVQDTQQCGGKVWEAAAVLSRYLHWRVSLDAAAFRGTVVMEVGAGTGVVGLALARMTGVQPTAADGIGALLLTDLAMLCPLMDANILANGFQAEHQAGTVRAVAVPWGEPLSPALPAVDVVLISDCVYLEECFEPLLQTMSQLITTRTVCYMSYKRRRRADRKFFSRLGKLFNVRQVTEDPSYADYSRKRLFLFEIKRK